MCNLPRKIDYWLMKRCPIDWIIDRLEYQYGVKFVNRIRKKGKYVIG